MKDGKCDLFFVLDVLLPFDNLDLNKKKRNILKKKKILCSVVFFESL